MTRLLATLALVAGLVAPALADSDAAFIAQAKANALRELKQTSQGLPLTFSLGKSWVVTADDGTRMACGSFTVRERGRITSTSLWAGFPAGRIIVEKALPPAEAAVYFGIACLGED